MPSAAPPPFPRVPTSSQVRVSKFVWRALVLFNFGVVAYLFAMPKTKEINEHKSHAAEFPSNHIGTTTPVSEDHTLHSSMASPMAESMQ